MLEKKRGRKPTHFDESELYEIIGKYKEEHQVKGKVKYLDVYRYQKELYEKGMIPKAFSEDFWRKEGQAGRKAIDVVNQLVTQKIRTGSDQEMVIPNVADAVYKYHQNPEELIRFLHPMEKQLMDSVAREIKLNKKLKDIEELLEVEKKKREEAQQAALKIQEAMFKMFRLSAYDDVPLVNQIRTGSTRTKLVDQAISKAFSDPMEFYEKLEETRNREKDSNVLSMNDKKEHKRSLLEDANKWGI